MVIPQRANTASSMGLLPLADRMTVTSTDGSGQRSGQAAKTSGVGLELNLAHLVYCFPAKRHTASTPTGMVSHIAVQDNNTSMVDRTAACSQNEASISPSLLHVIWIVAARTDQGPDLKMLICLLATPMPPGQQFKEVQVKRR
jgi:hypothetical protein